MILVSVAALGTVCLQLAMASPAGPMLIIALSTCLKGLTLLPQIVNRANLAVHACMIVGSILPQENSTNTVIALVFTPITLLIWNPRTQSRNLRLAVRTTRTHRPQNKHERFVETGDIGDMPTHNSHDPHPDRTHHR
jgi:hypothetical protein